MEDGQEEALTLLKAVGVGKMVCSERLGMLQEGRRAGSFVGVLLES